MIKSLKYTYTSKLLLAAFFLTSIFVVAQPTTGNITDKFTSPGSSYTFSHTQNSGSDRLLVVIVHNPNGTNTSGVTYGGVALTSKLDYNTSAIGWRTRIWYLEDPAEGSNNVVVTFSGNQTNKSGMIAVSFTNSDGIGVTGKNTSGGWAAWETVTLTVEDNSKILFGGLSSENTVNSLQSPTNTNITKEWNSSMCCSKGAFGGVSAALSAGSTSSRSKENNGHNYPYALEILSAVSCTNGTADAGSALTGICSGGTSSAMGGSHGGGANASTWSGGAGTWTNATDASTATYTADESESGDITLTLTATGGCADVTDTKTITVTAAPSAGTLSGTQGICVSGTSTFSSTVNGGTWSSSNTGIATINSSSGAISGVSAGTATMTYTIAGSGGCSDATATRTVTVTAAPASAGTLSGTQGICESGSTTFSSTVSGGTWSSSSTGIATINSSSGAISAVSASVWPVTITYTQAGSGGCSDNTATRTVTVTAAPASAGTLSGNQGILVSGSTTFSSTVNGGTWSSSNTGIATINSSSGAISGVSAGTATITYTQAGSGGCSDATATRTVLVYATAPGGFTDHLHLWLKADAGTNTTTNDGEIDAWADQTYNDFDSEDIGNNGPSYKTNAINGHPALAFDGSEDLKIEDGITGGTERAAYFFYVVSKRESNGSGDQHIFRQNLDNSKFLIFRHNGTTGYGAGFFYGGNSDDEGRHFATWSNSQIKPHLWSFGSATTSGTPNSTHQYIQLDNTTIDNDNNTTDVTGSSSNDFHIGAEQGSSDFYNGLIAEIICLIDIPTVEEDLKIKSYLSLKYGISLGTSTDLKNSAGTVVWNKSENTSYNNDITGIGRDDNSGLDQKTSQSVNSSDVLKISTLSNAQTGANNTFEMWANNGSSVAVQADNSGTAHDGTVFNETIPRKWLIQETGTVGAVAIEIDLTGSTFTSPDPQKMALVFDNDGGFDGSGEESFTVANTYDAGTKKLTFNSVDLTDGKYVSLMKSVSVLPVELLSFNVEAEGCFAHITWSTASEINNDYFSIEYSYDGVDWTEIDKVYGAGNSNEIIHYSHYDFDCFHNQLVYYRIVQVDFDGTRSSSKVKPLNVVQPYTVKIFPNPTKGNTTVEINAEFGDRTGNVVVRTMSGQKVFSKSIVNGKNQLNLMQLAPDTYIIKVSAPDQLPYYEKLVILK